MSQKLFGFYSEKQASVIRELTRANHFPVRSELSRRFDLYRRVADGAHVEVTEVRYADSEEEARAAYGWPDGVCHGQVVLRGAR